MSEVSSVHEQILSTYIDDFSKYANGRDLAQMQNVFARLGVNVAKKVKYVNFTREMRSRRQNVPLGTDSFYELDTYPLYAAALL